MFLVHRIYLLLLRQLSEIFHTLRLEKRLRFATQIILAEIFFSRQSLDLPRPLYEDL